MSPSRTDPVPPQLPPADVPVIDISPLFGNDTAAKQKVASQIDSACHGIGFFYAANHGVDVDALSAETQKFHFALTDEEKYDLAIRAYRADSKHVRNGYSLPIKGKKAVESWCFLNPNFTPEHPEIKAETPLHEVNDWPSEKAHPGFREFMEKYYMDVFDVSLHVLRGMALGLGKPEKFFDDYFLKSDTLSSVALIRYPYLDPYPPVKVADDGTKLSFEWHEDVSLITVLYQSNVQNLQVLTDLGYQDILANDKCFLINCGGFFDYITKGYFRAVRHRVKWINEERQSLPFFCNLGQHTAIKPWSPHEEGRDAKEEEKVMTYGEYLGGGLVALIKSNGQT